MKLYQHLLCLFLILTPSHGAETPPELKSLQEQRARKISEIDVIYKKQLEDLKIKYMKAGNLDYANQIAAILSGLQPEDSFKVEGIWQYGDLGEMELHPSGIVKFRWWPNNGKWSADKPGLLRLTSDTGVILEITIKDGIGSGKHPADGKPITMKKMANRVPGSD